MKHEYLTCDRCGKKISKKLPQHCSRAILTVKYSNPETLNLEAEMLRLKQEIRNMSYNFSVEVDVIFGVTERHLDLCHECGKELKLFLKKEMKEDD